MKTYVPKCNELLSFVNEHVRRNTSVNAHFRHHPETKCSMDDITNYNYLGHASKFINKWMNQIKKEMKYIKSPLVNREFTDIVNLDGKHIYIKYSQCSLKIINKRELLDSLVWILSITEEDEVERSCEIYKVLGKKGEYYLIDTFGSYISTYALHMLK